MLSAVIRPALGYPLFYRGKHNGTPEVRPSRPLVLGKGPPMLNPQTPGMDRTVHTFKPQLRPALMAKHPKPLEILTPSGEEPHRGAKPPPRCELLGKITFFPLEKLLSVERGPLSHRHRRITKADFRPATGGFCSNPFLLCLGANLRRAPEETFAPSVTFWDPYPP
ncbi:hypothetical protein OSB04_un001662 [Centaurea solstitialis]|uniref:Uncharacterized protein n=1 Tax=Centaurea solstitialis TaxID=347529 RepID=A0AA38S2X8_9ASTR|nr:hypothetical protein OSB04_un001662 [Centaurea solstitialis]